MVNEPESLAKFRVDKKFGEYKAPAAIVVCSSEKVMLEPGAADFWVQDCSAAIENILIAAVGLGLGTVWQGAYPKERTMQVVRELAGLPEDVTPLAVLYVGYPDEEKEARTRYEESRVHWQQY